LLYHRDFVRNLRCRNDIPVSMGSTVPLAELVRSLGSGSIPRHSRGGLHLGLQEGCSRVGLKFAGFSLGLLFFSLSSLHAAPVLRLSSSTVGPISLAAAGATNTQVLEAFNAGDGNLALSFSSSVPWVSASPGAPRTCRTLLTAVGKTCSTIQLSINTTGLPQGLSTRILTVSDPNAVDAPQTVTVTVRIGP